jgi:uncharacterized protein YecE (DUF72 family)
VVTQRSVARFKATAMPSKTYPVADQALDPVAHLPDPRVPFIGTAGWSIPRASAAHFAGDGTHLQRYARILGAAEINSSFHRPHAAATYQKWAESTAAAFRFAVKLPRTITHDQKLRQSRAPLGQFLEQSAGLGEKRGPLLVQLPPSLALEVRLVARFFGVLRELYDGPVVCEPRHASWFSQVAAALLVRHRVARVAADPPPAPGADQPGGWDGLIYYRLHGSPRKYWSRYPPEYIAAISAALGAVQASVETWCVFDNTASGAALENALELRASALHQDHF